VKRKLKITNIIFFTATIFVFAEVIPPQGELPEPFKAYGEIYTFLQKMLLPYKNIEKYKFILEGVYEDGKYFRKEDEVNFDEVDIKEIYSCNRRGVFDPLYILRMISYLIEATKIQPSILSLKKIGENYKIRIEFYQKFIVEFIIDKNQLKLRRIDWFKEKELITSYYFIYKDKNLFPSQVVAKIYYHTHFDTEDFDQGFCFPSRKCINFYERFIKFPKKDNYSERIYFLYYEDLIYKK
jgi:hypothetical protein